MYNYLIIPYVLTTAMGLILLKLGTKNSKIFEYVDGRLSLDIGIASLFGIVLYFISFMLYIILISKFDLGFIIPLTTGLVYTIIFISSFILFNETFSIIKIVGILSIFIGVTLLSISR